MSSLWGWLLNLGLQFLWNKAVYFGKLILARFKRQKEIKNETQDQTHKLQDPATTTSAQIDEAIDDATSHL